MILWKPNEQKIKEAILSGQKFGNYKGKDIGPFIRICNNCNINQIEYLTHDSMRGAEKRNALCMPCAMDFKFDKTKSKKTEYFKKCGDNNCETIIYYKDKYYLGDAIRINSICKECRKKNLSEMYSNGGLFQHKSKEDRDAINAKQTKSFIKYWQNNPDKLLEVQDKRGKIKRFDVEGYSCQGTYEKHYIELLIKENKLLPFKNKPVVNTPLGSYLPDFEFKDYYVEIKSVYTYECALKKLGQYINNNQIEKIIWTGKNIKPVKIIIFKNKFNEQEEIIFDGVKKDE